MKYSLRLVALTALALFSFSISLFGQDDDDEDIITEPIVFIEKFNVPFLRAWKAVELSITESGHCRLELKKVNDADSLMKGIMRSEACVLVSGEDSTREVMEPLSVEKGDLRFPFIRGARWESGRIQYRFKVREVSPNNIEVELTAEMSGMETFVTGKVHFWLSNGILEKEMMKLVKKNVASLSQGK